MDHPTEFVGLQLYPSTLKILFKLWQAKGRVVTYGALHNDLNTAQTHIKFIRQALKDIGAKWVIEIERSVGARLRKIEKY